MGIKIELIKKCEEITYDVTIPLNSTKKELVKILEKIPDEAKIEMIVGDDKFRDEVYGELIFRVQRVDDESL